MKTWFHLIPLIAVAIIVPFILVLLPTFELNGNYIGGGPIRQWLINSFSHALSAAHANLLVEKFMAASELEEILLTLPVAMNMSLVLLLMVYCLGTLFIELTNFITSGIYQSQRKRAKGA